MVLVSHLTKRYGGHTAVDDLSFTVEEGQIYGFLGPNGAGKSTTMNIMTGCLAATSGQVTIGGYDIFEEAAQAKRLMGYLPEQPPLYLDRTPREYLTFVAQAKSVPAGELTMQIDRVMAETGISHVAGRLIKNLSKGYRQRVGIAQALLGDPKVIILDEPTVGLDPKQMVEIRSLIQALGKEHTVILSSHILSEVQAVCQKILIISSGKLVAIPILTMRVLAEERKQKTDQLLYALPLTMTQVILGKYLAMLVLFLVPVAVICVYPILLSGFGNLYLPAAFGAIGGFFLLGMALLAVGMFISSVTESQPVAAGLCFAVLLVNYFLSSLSGYLSSTAFGSFLCLTVVILVLALIVWRMTRNGLAAFLTAAVLEVGMTVWFVLASDKFEGLVPSILDQLSLFERFYTFVDGVFDLTAVVYFITVSFVFLFLSVQSMEKRRWSA